MPKIVKGSALIDDEGGMIFTPYNSCPEENSPWSTIACTFKGQLRVTRRKVYLQVVLERTPKCSELIGAFSRETSALIASLLRPSTERKYQESLKPKKGGEAK